LIVDDELTIRRMLGIAMRGSRLDLTICGSGRGALAAIFRAYRFGRPFTAVILDCAMPLRGRLRRRNVIRCAERQSEAFPRARIAFFTAYDKTVEKTTLLEEVEADAYWRKDEVAHRLPELIEASLMNETADPPPH
jgi:CheY-like chemotaxis protein